MSNPEPTAERSATPRPLPGPGSRDGAQAQPALASALRQSRWRLPAIAAACLLAIATLTRLVLVGFHPEWLTAAPAALAVALASGFAADVVAIGWVLLPLVLYLLVLPERWFAGRWHRRLIAGAFFCAAFGWLFVAAAEVVFFAEFDGRFNFVAVDYLLYPTEVSENIWQSYPTGWILATLLGLALALAAAIRPRLAPAWEQPTRWRGRTAVASTYLGVLALITAVGAPSPAVLRTDRALAEVAANGYTRFFIALLGSDAPYEGLYPTLDDPTVAARLDALLGIDRPADDAAGAATALARATAGDGTTIALTSTRQVVNPGPERRLNVVVVLEESLGSEFIGALYPRERSLTPEIDALAASGTLLTQVYSTGNRTIRALEATTSSLPPLPGASIVRRSQSVDLFTLPSLLADRGYQTSFVYGGRALFDGMQGYLTANGIADIIDLADFPDAVFTTAWGAADEHIFDRTLVAMEAMRAAGRPFYSLVLTVSNHRPYAFPQDHVQFDPSLKRRENAVRYADWALGRFVRQAWQRGFDRDTLFVLMGDHGARVYGAAEIPLPSYEVPVLLLGPGIAAGQRIDTLASSLDIPPTILARLGMSYTSRFFGQDVFTTPPAAGRALVTHNNEVALLRDHRIAILGLRGRTAVFRYQRGMDRFEPIHQPGDDDRQVVTDAMAYFTGADRLYRNGGYRWPATSGEIAQPNAAIAAQSAAGAEVGERKGG